MAKAEIVQTETVTPNTLLALAVEGGADPDRLDKLMALQERWEANQAKKAYVEAMAQFRSECPAIDKTKNGHNNKYAGLSETIEAIKGLLSRCGLSHTWKTNQENGTITVRCVVTHVLGHSEETSLTAAPDTTGSKNPIQAIGSTVSYLERYTLFALLGLASQEMDDDGSGSGKTGPKPEDDVTKLIADAFESYCNTYCFDLPQDQTLDAEKFKAAIRQRFLKLKPADRKKFVWNKEGVASLVETIEPEEIASPVN